MEHTQHSLGAKYRLLAEIKSLMKRAGEKGSELNQTKAEGLGGQLAESACHQPIGHACVLHQQVYKYVSCFTLHVRRDGNPDGILNAAFNVVSFSRLVHPSLVCHLVPSQPVIGTFTLESLLLISLPEHFQQFAPQSACIPSTSALSHKTFFKFCSRELSVSSQHVWSMKANYKHGGKLQSLQVTQMTGRISQREITDHARKIAKLKKTKLFLKLK